MIFDGFPAPYRYVVFIISPIRPVHNELPFTIRTHIHFADGTLNPSGPTSVLYVQVSPCFPYQILGSIDKTGDWQLLLVVSVAADMGFILLKQYFSRRSKFSSFTTAIKSFSFSYSLTLSKCMVKINSVFSLVHQKRHWRKSMNRFPVFQKLFSPDCYFPVKRFHIVINCSVQPIHCQFPWTTFFWNQFMNSLTVNPWGTPTIAANRWGSSLPTMVTNSLL